MKNVDLLNIVTFAYFVSFLLYLLLLVMRKDWFGKSASIFSRVIFLVHTLALGLRWWESHQMGFGHAPLSNRYESLIFFAWTIMLLYLLIEWRTKNRSLGAFATLLAFLSMAYAAFSNSDIRPLLPALKSNWLIAHVITCFFSYAAFGLSFGLSILYLVKRSQNPGSNELISRIIPDRIMLDDLNYQIIIIGFILLTLGIITGAVWGQTAWGRYWGWDPKETWSFITWVVYAIIIHLRIVWGIRGKWMAILSIVGFLCVIFTYQGVNYLAGMHSYGQS
jgi:cytochrome c-type biogenesis protein CcsB